MALTSNTVIHISVLDAETKLLVHLTIALIAVTNMSLGMAQHSDKLNT